MSVTSQWGQREYLGAELRRLRQLAGLSGQQIAEKLRLSQSTISRAESGQRLLSLPQVRAWVRATAATPQTRDRLLALTEAAYNEVQLWPDVMAGVTHLQKRAAEMDQESMTIRSFWPIIMPGLVQTAEYARRIFELCDWMMPGQDIPASVAARMDRQRILYEPDRTIDFLISESALRFTVGPEPVMRAQRDRLTALDSLEKVSVGIVPLGGQTSAIGWHHFTIHDDVTDGAPYVYVELAHGELTLPDPQVVERYRRLWDELAKTALYGEAAAEFMRSLNDD